MRKKGKKTERQQMRTSAEYFVISIYHRHPNMLIWQNILYRPHATRRNLSVQKTGVQSQQDKLGARSGPEGPLSKTEGNGRL